MKRLREYLNQQEKHFQKGGKLHGMYYLYEAIDGFLYTWAKPTHGSVHVRDVMDLKRMMITVFFALVPAVLMAIYNTGLQANRILTQSAGMAHLNWQQHFVQWTGMGFDPSNFWAVCVHGLLYFLPLYILTLVVGGFWEVLFASIRKHEVNEGFLVSSLIFPLILPPNIPYWQAALGISFGIVLGKEVFGGVGMNIVNPALLGRAFLFFAYPAQISGDRVWVAVDGVSRATPLAQWSDAALSFNTSWLDAFLGFIPGSMGETSALACLIGAVILLAAGIISWRILFSLILGVISLSCLFNWIGSPTNPMFAMPAHWHLVLGGLAFGSVFMATDPVTAAQTEKGQLIYGFLIGALVVMVRVVNPAFPEGVMLAILFGNIFSPLIDQIFIQGNIKRRQARYGRK